MTHLQWKMRVFPVLINSFGSVLYTWQNHYMYTTGTETFYHIFKYSNMQADSQHHLYKAADYEMMDIFRA